MKNSIFISLVFSVLFLGCVHKETPVLAPLPLADKNEIQSQVLLYQQGDKIQAVGGLSDLVFSKSESTEVKLIFYAMTDRGPNGNSENVGKELRREFLIPKFVPQILKLSYDVTSKKAEVVEAILLRKNRKNMTGLPTRDETPTFAGKKIAMDPQGIDTESLALDAEGNFWVGDEYGPDVLNFSRSGELLGRWSPGRGLPAFVAGRELNRGFEAATLTAKGTVFFILQSEVPALKNKLAPMVEFDPAQNKTVAVYFYPMDPQGGKIGAASLGENGEIYILEQNGKTGEKAWQKIFALNFEGATRDVSSLKAKSSWQMDGSFVPVGKTERVNLTNLGLGSLEKLEGMAWTPQNGFAIVNDNDFEVVSTLKREPKIGSFLIFVK